MSLVRGRLLEGAKFFDHGSLRPEFGRSEVKLSLLLIKIANPGECLTGPELALLEGGQRKVTSLNTVSTSLKAVLASQPKKAKNRG